RTRWGARPVGLPARRVRDPPGYPVRGVGPMSRYSRNQRYNYRRARRAWRGQEPMGFMVVDPGDSLTVLAAIAFGKWAHRHRSAFYPYLLGLVFWVAAGLGHKHHAGVWIPVTPVTILVTTAAGIPHGVLKRHQKGTRIASGLARFWSVFGIDRGV